jgi:hypothetical protein
MFDPRDLDRIWRPAEAGCGGRDCSLAVRERVGDDRQEARIPAAENPVARGPDRCPAPSRVTPADGRQDVPVDERDQPRVGGPGLQGCRGIQPESQPCAVKDNFSPRVLPGEFRSFRLPNGRVAQLDEVTAAPGQRDSAG